MFGELNKGLSHREHSLQRFRGALFELAPCCHIAVDQHGTLNRSCLTLDWCSAHVQHNLATVCCSHEHIGGIFSGK